MAAEIGCDVAVCAFMPPERFADVYNAAQLATGHYARIARDTDGLLVREATVGDHPSAELLGPGDVIVLIGNGPSGTGMQETAQITTALKYLPWGKHVALVTDGRFSGLSTGACIALMPRFDAEKALALMRPGASDWSPYSPKAT